MRKEDMRGHLTQQQLEDSESAFRKDPAAQKRREITVALANQIGGETLELLRLYRGYYWGEPYMLSFEECAIVLDRPVSEVKNLFAQLMNQVQPLWKATPEYQAWKAFQK